MPYKGLAEGEFEILFFPRWTILLNLMQPNGMEGMQGHPPIKFYISHELIQMSGHEGLDGWLLPIHNFYITTHKS